MRLRSYFCKPNLEPFVPPSKEEFEEYSRQMEGLGMAGKAIQSFSLFEQRAKENYDKRQSLLMEERVAMIESPEDIKRIENSEGFIRWIHD